MATHELVDAIDYTADGQRHCDGCGEVCDREGGFTGEFRKGTGTICEVSVCVKASPFRGEDLCRKCVSQMLAEHAVMIYPESQVPGD